MNPAKVNQQYTRDLAIITALTCLGAWGSATFFLNQFVPLSFWLSITFLVLVSFFVHRFLVRANDKRPQIFVASFMGALTAKLFLSAIVLLVIGLVDNDSLNFTAVGYLIGYMLLLVAEIKNLLPLIRSASH
jgi:hypothetical protein